MLIANMVGRNEANRYLPEVLEHLSNTVDLIVFTDDCSTDDTPKIAEDFGAKVFQTPENLFTKDESKLRTFAWQNLSRFANLGDWILAIDCDEKLYDTRGTLLTLLRQPQYNVLGVTFFHMWNETQYRSDKAWAPTVSSRLFRYYEGGKFRVSRLACGSEPTYVTDLINKRSFLANTGLAMQHLGYVRDEDKQAKYERYMKLDGGDYHSRQHLESIVDKAPRLIDWKF